MPSVCSAFLSDGIFSKSAFPICGCERLFVLCEIAVIVEFADSAFVVGVKLISAHISHEIVCVATVNSVAVAIRNLVSVGVN